MSNDRTPTIKIPTASKPIPIMPSAFPRGRPRSLSVSSGESSGSASSPGEVQTPLSTSAASPRINASPGTSPILSYFLAQSPTKTPGTFPFRKFGAPPVFEEEEAEQKDLPAVSHARRASTAVAGRFAQTPNTAIPEAHSERGQGLLRRLSLSTGFMSPTDGKRSPPNAPPNTAVNTTQTTPSAVIVTAPDGPPAAPRRSAQPTAGRAGPRPPWASASSRATLTASTEPFVPALPPTSCTICCLPPSFACFL
ncbi:hypothetical protein MVEN_02126500 [Mycena venus]|uniref:Uncharacterized protein n=1 Tax=Mycena venus TaxID=2733690 RepID=A0A8H6X9E8_9AGAR|nr:hypothetical protein MVEN_02126500 [Mycena venus]